MSSDTLDRSPIVSPIQRGRMAVTLTSPWELNGSEYRPHNAGFQLLINGEDAFAEVHRAIAGARKSVSIVCWGFQPSMYFIRDGAHPPIGKLLEEAALRDVQVRVLCWELALANLPIAVTGTAGEANTPGRWSLGMKNRPNSTNDEQYKLDVDWYNRYDDDQEWFDELAKWGRAQFGKDKRAQNIQFRGRGFSTADRVNLATKDYDDDVSKTTRATLSLVPSHHQKMVLVDVEDPELAIGFVMGHNMLDAYWDTSMHSSRPRSLYRTGTPEKDPDRVANGLMPRHDFSSKVSGPILGDLYNNFSVAWKKAGGDSLPKLSFENHPVKLNDGMQFISGQILRTQPQVGKGVEDIKRCYLQAVNNATQYIHIENQYFRWPPLAEAIKAAAEKQTQAGRNPQRDGYLYLFVITNSGDEGVGAGIDNTYRMMKALGRRDTLPQVARQEWLADIEATRWEIGKLEAEQAQLDARATSVGTASRAYPGIQAQREANARKLGAAQERLSKLEAQRDQVAKEYDEQEAKNKQAAQADKSSAWPDEIDHEQSVIQPEEIPGLKTHICTLVAPDTADGEPWMEVYIHAKLMMIDDTFMTLGSANINTRSMQVDSELNIAHHRPEITAEARRKLWATHTGGRSGSEECRPDDLARAYQQWAFHLDNNRALRSNHRSPDMMLTPLVRLSSKRANMD